MTAPPTTPTSAPVEDVGGLVASPLRRAQSVAKMLMDNLRLARGEAGVKGWRGEYVAREYAALMGLNLDGPANLTATDLAVYAYPEAADETKRRAFESGFLAALSPSLIQPRESLQARVRPWMLACFNPEIAADKLERNDRFIEEALELIQASDYPKERAHALVEYVYGRPQGDINQEVGGVMITLAAHCLAHGVDMHEAGETELARINQPDIIVKIRAKQAGKPKGSALPMADLIQPQGEERS